DGCVTTEPQRVVQEPLEASHDEASGCVAQKLSVGDVAEAHACPRPLSTHQGGHRRHRLTHDRPWVYFGLTPIGDAQHHAVHTLEFVELEFTDPLGADCRLTL